jgi:hypothetical protein
MIAVIEAAKADSAASVKERLEQFGREVLAEAMNRPAQMENGGLDLRGLIEQGRRKSLEPLVERLGEEADYSPSSGAGPAAARAVSSPSTCANSHLTTTDKMSERPNKASLDGIASGLRARDEPVQAPARAQAGSCMESV